MSQRQRVRDLIAEGRLHVGMSRAEAKAVLGEPDAVGGTSRRYRTPSIYRIRADRDADGGVAALR
jgi:hypothetical protein